MDYEIYYDEIKENTLGTAYTTVPKRLMELFFKKGDKVKIMIKKIEE
jgi:hypothetical protein